jgi:hypothetical protein
MSPTITPIDVITMLALAVFMTVMFFKISQFRKMIKPAAEQIVRGGGSDLSLRQTSHYETAIYDIIRQLRIEFTASDVYIARFHNGGNFANGTRMKKFSVTYGIAVSQQKELLKYRFYDKFCSHWADMIDELLVQGDYIKPDVKDEVLCRDVNFRRDMTFYNFESVYIFLIYQPDAAKTPEGFLAINFGKYRLLTKEEQDRIKEDLPKLVALMNLTTVNN